jgi:hypothetical protein
MLESGHSALNGPTRMTRGQHHGFAPISSAGLWYPKYRSAPHAMTEKLTQRVTFADNIMSCFNAKPFRSSDVDNQFRISPAHRPTHLMCYCTITGQNIHD